MQALRALNAARSPVFTAKCDAWAMYVDEIAQLQMNLDAPSVLDFETPHAGFASYIDLIWRDRSLFGSFHLQEQLLHRLARLAEPLDRSDAMLDCVLRPALVDLSGPQEGFAVSLYVKALGSTPQTAWKEWAATLAEVVALIRSKDFLR
jgi:hypothetical protein